MKKNDLPKCANLTGSMAGSINNKIMKKLLTFLIIISTLVFDVSATNYYVSNSGSDSNNGLTISTPIASISKLNSLWSSINAGDSILFKCGDSFFGTITPAKSGTSSLPIIISSYGIGLKPIINGFQTVSGWSETGTSIYTANASFAASNLNLVTINGVVAQVGRWPNKNASNGGYVNIVGVSGSTSNNSSASFTLVTTPPFNPIGAEYVFRKKNWILERGLITNYSGPTISYNQPSTGNVYLGEVGFGAFIQKHISTLDQNGEWYFDGTNIHLYSSSDPTMQSIKVSAKDTLINLTDKNYFKVIGLKFTGANKAAISSYYPLLGGITVTNCEFDLNGKASIVIFQSANYVITQNTITNSLGSAIFIRNNGSGGIRGGLVQNNVVSKISLIAGMDVSGDADTEGRSAITVNTGFGNTCRYNSIDSVGYNGIEFKGDSTFVEYNKINYYNIIKDDGAGIYWYLKAGKSVPFATNVNVNNNIILNGIGAAFGTPYTGKARGIYLDEGANNAAVVGNLIAFIKDAGLYGNNNFNIRYANNVVLKCGKSIAWQRFPNTDTIRSIRYVNNVFLPHAAEFRDRAIDSPYLRTIQMSLQRGMYIDSNIVNYNTNVPFTTISVKNNGTSYQMLTNTPTWYSSLGYDANGRVLWSSSDSIKIVYNWSNASTTISLGSARYADKNNAYYNGAIVLPAYGFAYLRYMSNITSTPIIKPKVYLFGQLR